MNNTILQNKRVLITAGPTREAIDPVRYISNHSSGKMGYAIATAFLEAGAEVFLISGPVSIQLQHPNLTLVKVNSALEMYLNCCRYFEEVDVAVFAAAVADYRPEKAALQKIKKEEAYFNIKMVKNVDIAAEFGKIKNTAQLSIGFALETNDEMVHAAKKLTGKNLDLVILNSMNDEQATFGYDTNKITIIRKDFTKKQFPLKPKQEVAADIIDETAFALYTNKKYQAENLVEHEYKYG